MFRPGLSDKNPSTSRTIHRKPNQHFHEEVSSLSPGLTAAAPGGGKVVKPHYWKVHPVRFPLRAGGCVKKCSDFVSILTPNLDNDIPSGGQGVLFIASFKNVKISNQLKKSPHVHTIGLM